MTAPTDFIEIPSGALCGEIMQLTCKGPDEERSYVIEYSQQLDPDDYIAPTGITWTAGDTALSVTNITSHGRRFRFTLSGGTLNQKSGLTFVLPLVSGDVREITFVITIEEQGVLQSGTIPVIMGAQGARGTIIWPYVGNTVPPNDWTPQSGVAIRTGDFVLVSGTHQIYEITVDNQGLASYALFVDLGAYARINPDTIITTETNSISIGNLVDNQAASKKVTDFFHVSPSGELSIDPETKIGDTGKNLSDVLSREDQLPSGTYYIDQSNVVRLARQIGDLPSDLSLNGGVYMAGATALPTGLTSNGGVVMTDGSVYFPNTINNIGVLCAVSE